MSFAGKFGQQGSDDQRGQIVEFVMLQHDN